MSTDLRVSILSRNEIVREGLKLILKDQGFLVGENASEVVDLLAMMGIADVAVSDVIVVDSNTLDEGLPACEELRRSLPSARIVLMADEYSIENVARAFGTGAVDGYLVKAISCEPLAGALRLIAMGEKVMPSQVADSLSRPLPRSIGRNWDLGGSGSNLSAREFEILQCLVEGDANKVISRRLHIADATVKVHIKAILRKLRVKNRTQAAVWANSHGVNVAEQPEPFPVAA
jgi:two-component system nitrate/nitrite response regulator NarL